MIGKLFPRLLNKSANRSAIKPNEFTDALNILVTSDDGGDGNIIKKGNGTIRSVVADPENFPFPDIGVSENVVGHLVDQEKQRVYYFAHGEGSNGKSSAIYLLKQTGENEISLMCLLRDDDLDFSSKDFVDADLIRVPVRKIDTGTDSTVSGATGDDTSPFEDDGLTEEEGSTSAFSIVTPPTFPSPYQITTADYNASGFQYEGGSITVGNFGTANATATITIEVLANGTGVTAAPIFSNQGTATATITVPGSSFGLEIPFSFTVSNAANAGGDFSIPFKVTVSEQQTGNLTGPPFFQEYTETINFVSPQILYPENFVVRYQGTNFLQTTNTPNVFAEDWGAVDLGEIPENEFNAIIGPFQVEITGDEPNEFQYRPDLTFQAYTAPVGSQSPVQGAWTIGGIADSIADVFVPTPTTSLSSYQSSLNTTIAGDIPLADQTFSFWIVKATDTIDWIDDYGPDFVIPFTILLQDGREFTLTSGQSSFHEGDFVAQVSDVPTPPQIIVENPFGAIGSEAVFAPHVDDNTFEYSGQEQQFGFTVTNNGETEGFFRINTDWSKTAYNDLFDNYSGQDLQQYIQGFETENQGRWRGMWEMTYFDLLDPSSGTLISGPHNLFSNRYTNLEFGAGEPPLGSSMSGVAALQGWFTNQPENVFQIPGESSILVRFYASNAEDLFATAGFSGGGAEIGGDSTISDVYVGNSGPYSFWGEPNSSTGSQNSDALDVFVETSVDNSGLSGTFSTTVFASTVVYDVDPDYVGPLKIWAPKRLLQTVTRSCQTLFLEGQQGRHFLILSFQKEAFWEIMGKRMEKNSFLRDCIQMTSMPTHQEALLVALTQISGHSRQWRMESAWDRNK